MDGLVAENYLTIGCPGSSMLQGLVSIVTGWLLVLLLLQVAAGDAQMACVSYTVQIMCAVMC